VRHFVIPAVYTPQIPAGKVVATGIRRCSLQASTGFMLGGCTALSASNELELRGFYVKKMFVGGLPLESTEETVTEMFNEYGKVRSIKLAADVFTGKCKGFGFIEMEGHEARAAIAGLNGKIIGDKSLKVQFEEPRKGGKKGGRRR